MVRCRYGSFGTVRTTFAALARIPVGRWVFVSTAAAVASLLRVLDAQHGGLCIACVESDVPAFSQHAWRARWQQSPMPGAAAPERRRNAVIAASNRRIAQSLRRSALAWQPDLPPEQALNSVATNSRSEVTPPPAIGAAIRFITSAPARATRAPARGPRGSRRRSSSSGGSPDGTVHGRLMRFASIAWL